MLCFRLYHVFQINGYAKEGFSSINALACKLDESSGSFVAGKGSDKSSRFISDMVKRGVLFFDNNERLFFNDDKFTWLLDADRDFDFVQEYIDDTSTVRIP